MSSRWFFNKCGDKEQMRSFQPSSLRINKTEWLPHHHNPAAKHNWAILIQIFGISHCALPLIELIPKYKSEKESSIRLETRNNNYCLSLYNIQKGKSIKITYLAHTHSYTHSTLDIFWGGWWSNLWMSLRQCAWGWMKSRDRRAWQEFWENKEKRGTSKRTNRRPILGLLLFTLVSKQPHAVSCGEQWPKDHRRPNNRLSVEISTAPVNGIRQTINIQSSNSEQRNWKRVLNKLIEDRVKQLLITELLWQDLILLWQVENCKELWKFLWNFRESVSVQNSHLRVYEDAVVAITRINRLQIRPSSDTTVFFK